MTPHNKLGSEELANEARSAAKRSGAEFEFLDYDTLNSMGAGAFCSVLKTSPSKGGIAILKRQGKTREVILVGKGITFDTGGLDLKTEGSMLGMNRDMTGAAVALSAFESLCALKPNLSLYCYVAMALRGLNGYTGGLGVFVGSINIKTL
jgi:leucyl aminopeptidase